MSRWWTKQKKQTRISRIHNIDSDKLKQTIDGHKKKLESYNSLLANVKFQRDRVIAHFDRKHITNPSAILSNPSLDMDDVGNCYRELLQIINDYNLYNNKSEFILINIEEEVAGDLEFLLSSIEELDNESKLP